MHDELAAITFTLRPRKFNRIPHWQGRAAQALFYGSLHDIHPMLSETVHDLHKWQPIMPKPFTMSTLTGAAQDGDLLALHPDQPVCLRLTSLHPHLTGICLNGIKPQWQQSGLRLHDQLFYVAHIQIVRTTYADILTHADDDDGITLHFAAPTAFKQTGKGYLAEPIPGYIFQSLFNRWNGLAQWRLPAALRRAIDHQLELVEADVQRTVLSFARGKKGVIPGFYGRVVIAIREASRELRRYFNALATFAAFSGVGIKTTVGMGQITPFYSPQESK